MSQILNAIEMANKAGLGHFLHQDPISKERRTSRGRHTSRNKHRTSRVRRTSRNKRRTSRVRRTSRNKHRTSRGRHTSQNRRRSSNSFWDNVLF